MFAAKWLISSKIIELNQYQLEIQKNPQLLLSLEEVLHNFLWISSYLFTAYICILLGPAGFQCALSLREEGFVGRIVMITSEDVTPYDRPQLSKVSKVQHNHTTRTVTLTKHNIHIFLVVCKMFIMYLYAGNDFKRSTARSTTKRILWYFKHWSIVK